ncbi:hypothetical protein N7510_005246 [Penicillium lagena]|uniref:uncharacterized protein n=1 Tax=Penicillium lagena TaxID=94218 RepID=UPI002540531E|nr:uncharacterized protein N7510_005246 [Penicillium lagena]KAJ5612052.1 hypothetical protein N7510_005246 [Penicillium lagena]
MHFAGSTVRLAALAVSLTTPLAHAYYLDESCNDNQGLITQWLNSAFSQAQAASDMFDSLASDTDPSDPSDVWIAQRDLLSYMFPSTLSNDKPSTSSAAWLQASKIFEDVLKYKGAQAAPRVTRARPARYSNLDKSSVVIYCTYDRFTAFQPPDAAAPINYENQDCAGQAKPGFACDPTIDADIRMEPSYQSCKNTRGTVSHLRRSVYVLMYRLTDQLVRLDTQLGQHGCR